MSGIDWSETIKALRAAYKQVESGQATAVVVAAMSLDGDTTRYGVHVQGAPLHAMALKGLIDARLTLTGVDLLAPKPEPQPAPAETQEGIDAQ